MYIKRNKHYVKNAQASQTQTTACQYNTAPNRLKTLRV